MIYILVFLILLTLNIFFAKNGGCWYSKYPLNILLFKFSSSFLISFAKSSFNFSGDNLSLDMTHSVLLLVFVYKIPLIQLLHQALDQVLKFLLEIHTLLLKLLRISCPALNKLFTFSKTDLFDIVFSYTFTYISYFFEQIPFSLSAFCVDKTFLYLSLKNIICNKVNAMKKYCLVI